MLNRFSVSVSLALLGLLAATGPAFAASERTEVMVGAGAVSIGLMILLTIAYLGKVALGLVVPPEPVADDDHGHGGHH